MNTPLQEICAIPIQAILFIAELIGPSTYQATSKFFYQMDIGDRTLLGGCILVFLIAIALCPTVHYVKSGDGKNQESDTQGK